MSSKIVTYRADESTTVKVEIAPPEEFSLAGPLAKMAGTLSSAGRRHVSVSVRGTNLAIARRFPTPRQAAHE